MRDSWSYITEVSDNYILDCYLAIRRELGVDPANVREHPDFREWASALEAEMDKRGVDYVRVVF
ncbi:hypothetical protein [Caulobacter sp. Root343]|uniref:hypothetical protein n=1 Tax=Caulobacter sp. Root343 TaxID=1736520 RepID=UPI0006F20FBC|nr:hypothetical protein [Caulobacter sp. Root343]KQV66657.1 hypothetical protein ASC70_12550 [Caulobacter sp. Root343]